MADSTKKSIFKRWWFWAIVVIVFIFIVAGSGGNNTQPKKVAPTAGQSESTTNGQMGNQQAEKTPEFFKVGETAELNGVKATVTGIEKPAGDSLNKPDEGKEFVIVNMTIENTSDREINVSSILSFHAYADDTAINEDLMAQTAKKGATTMDGTVAPGKKLSGSLGYQLSKGWKILEIEYKPDQFSNNTIKWQIENK